MELNTETKGNLVNSQRWLNCGPDDVGKGYAFVIKDKSKGMERNLG